MSQSDSIQVAPAMEEEKKNVAAVSSATRPEGASDHSGNDEEKHVTEQPKLKRKLKSRHLQMIAIGTVPISKYILLS
jgi:amino acid permease